MTKRKVELGIKGNPLTDYKYKSASLFSPTSNRSPSLLNLKMDLNALLRQNYLRTIYDELKLAKKTEKKSRIINNDFFWKNLKKNISRHHSYFSPLYSTVSIS